MDLLLTKNNMVLNYVNLIHNCIISYSLSIILLSFFYNFNVPFNTFLFISLIHDMHLLFHITDTYPDCQQPPALL